MILFCTSAKVTFLSSARKDKDKDIESDESINTIVSLDETDDSNDGETTDVQVIKESEKKYKRKKK